MRAESFREAPRDEDLSSGFWRKLARRLPWDGEAWELQRKQWPKGFWGETCAAWELQAGPGRGDRSGLENVESSCQYPLRSEA